MKKLLFSALLVFTAGSPVLAKAEAINDNGEQKKAKRVVSGEEADRLYLEHQLGGEVRDVRSQKGRLVVVNAQKTVDESWLKASAQVLADAIRVAACFESGSFDLKKPDLKGEATIFVVDDPELPMSLVAPEAKWAMMNVAPLKSDKEPFYRARVNKELTRVIAYLLGAADSQWPMSITGCVTSPKDLDSYPGAGLPFDLMQRLVKYTPRLGITQYKVSDYLTACQEGWAHSPTNKYQKRIWDRVHELPTNPLPLVKPKK